MMAALFLTWPLIYASLYGRFLLLQVTMREQLYTPLDLHLPNRSPACLLPARPPAARPPAARPPACLLGKMPLTMQPTSKTAATALPAHCIISKHMPTWPQPTHTHFPPTCVTLCSWTMWAASLS